MQRHQPDSNASEEPEFRTATAAVGNHAHVTRGPCICKRAPSPTDKTPGFEAKPKRVADHQRKSVLFSIGIISQRRSPVRRLMDNPRLPAVVTTYLTSSPSLLAEATLGIRTTKPKRANQSKPNQAKPHHAKPSQAKPHQTTSNHTKPSQPRPSSRRRLFLPAPSNEVKNRAERKLEKQEQRRVQEDACKAVAQNWESSEWHLGQWTQRLKWTKTGNLSS